MALRDQPYLPLYINDFMTDEKLMLCSAESTGVYIRLICMMHKSAEYGSIALNKKFQQNDNTIKNFAMQLSLFMPYPVGQIERSLIELAENEVIYISCDRITQKRMHKDGEISENRSSAGKKGMESRYRNDDVCYNKTPNKHANKTLTNSENENEYENDIENDIEDENIKINIQDQRFEEFWKIYPRKVGKGAARKSWKKINPTEELFNRIILAVEAAKKTDQWKRDNGQYIPYPATWLNQGRWDDDYSIPTNGHSDRVNQVDEWTRKLEQKLGNGERSGAG